MSGGGGVPKITGRKAATKRIGGLGGGGMADRISRALFAAGNMIQTEAQISITEGSVSGKGHVASLPGEPPNNDTGVLANNIETVLVEPLLVEVSSNARYASALEYGTSKMAPRPYMAPAVAKRRAEAVKLVGDAVRIEIKRGGRDGD